jgi:hypothetical protein
MSVRLPTCHARRATNHATSALSHTVSATEPDRQHLRDVVPRQLFETQFRSPQLPVWEIGDGEWLKVVRVPEATRRRKRRAVGEQLRLAQ